jgi:hypothetical protein
MNGIAAKVIADSISPQRKRLRSLELRMPRIILAEFNTHRKISKNTRSSRAVPVERVIEEVMTNPFIPHHWGAAQKGMQAYQETSAPIDMGPLIGGSIYPIEATNEQAWLFGRDQMVKLAEEFHKAGYAKQIINRLLEPWMWVDTLATSTEWNNFLWLRDHHAAEPHIQRLAKAMKVAMADSEPVELRPGEWHVPYVERGSDDARAIVEYGTSIGKDGYEIGRKVSVARCARISYAPFDGNGSIEKELERYDLLVGSSPIHASPAEHQATPDETYPRVAGMGEWKNPHLHGNLDGWNQFRKYLPNENMTEMAA